MRYSWIVISVMAFFLSGNVLNGVTQFSESGVQEFNTPVEAPDFTLEEIGGSKISMGGLRGKVILLNFFTSW